MHSILQALQLVYLIGLTSSSFISAAVIPASVRVSRNTILSTSISTSVDDSTNSSDLTNSSDSSSSTDTLPNHSLTSTSTSNPFTSLNIAQAQPSFCPYDSLTQPQPVLFYDLSTAPLASDCAHILDIINDTQPRGYWTFDTSDLEKGITLVGYGSCAFEMIKDGEVSEGGYGENEKKKNSKKAAEQVKWGVEELKFYLGTWLQKQRHGRLGAVGEVDCWVEGEQRKEEGGVRVRWMVVRRQQEK